jgi:osmotically-inducible protein OsmY
MDNDSVIRDRVAAELDFDPSVRASDIAVATCRGIVTLYGFAPSHADKVGAIRAVHRVAGVRALAVEVVVRAPAELVTGDRRIAEHAASILAMGDAGDKVRITVENGWVTLHGCIETKARLEKAEAAVRNLQGVTGVTNSVQLACDSAAIDLRDRIVAGLKRDDSHVADGVAVEVVGSSVTLSGCVPTLLQLKSAEAVAWAAPNVTSVRNHLKVTQASA